MNAVLVHSGDHFSLSEPSAGAVHLGDIAVSLSRLARFTGHTRGGIISVAQHSVLVADLVRLQVPGSDYYLPPALLHDAHEAYTGDINTPMAREIVRVACLGFDPITDIKDRIQCAIMTRFRLMWPHGPGVEHVIKTADKAAMILERDRFMAPNPDSRLKWEEDEEARQLAHRSLGHVRDVLDEPWNEHRAYREFMQEAAYLGIA